MINLVIALTCEAIPWIDYFKLKPKSRIPFKVYSNEQVRLIISGVGKINGAAATAYLHAQVGAKEQIWVNCGIAGHPNLALGTLIFAHKITDKHSNKSYYPAIVKNFLTKELITSDHPNLVYEEDSAFDMEASGFFAMASRFSCIEKIYCCKVISDNSENPAKILDKQEVSSLISEHIPLISPLLAPPTDNAIDLTVFTSRWHFTETEQHQLNTLLNRLQACGEDLDLQFDTLKKSSDVLHYLRKKIDSTPLIY